MNYDLIFSFITLSFLEIILGIDNLIFIALVVSKLPNQYRKSARAFGLILAFVIRCFCCCRLDCIEGGTQDHGSCFPLLFVFVLRAVPPAACCRRALLRYP
jgi:predicted tellurium resistance membrane protein TerC